MPLTASDTPSFSDTLPELTTSSVAHPDTWNPIHQRLLDNTVVLQRAHTELDQNTEQALSELGDRFNAIELSSAVGIQRAVLLDWLYRDNRIALELWTPGLTLIDTKDVTVTNGVGGDDSLDVVSTASLNAGEYCVLSVPAEDGIPAQSTLVRVASVLSDTRLRLANNITQSVASGVLTQCSMNVVEADHARAEVGQIWLSKAINLGLAGAGAVVVRRTLNAGTARLYYRDAYTPDWTECLWSVRRQGESIPVGFADVEYMLPMRGMGYLRLEVSDEPMELRHIVALSEPTNLGGLMNTALRPNAPVISNPSAGAINVLETPTLTASGYLSPAGNAFAIAEFQISTSSTFATLLHDSGRVPAQSYSVPAGVLAANTLFYVRSRVSDVAGLVSDWSAVSSFTTKSTYAYIKTPLLLSPTAGQTGVVERPTLQSSAFAVVGGSDTHASSQWQIRLASGNWNNPVHNSGTTTADKTSYTVPAGVLSAQTNYIARVKHTGSNFGASEWSPDIPFTTKNQFWQIVGITLSEGGDGSGTWQRIDQNFNAVTVDQATFSNHPTYANILDQLIDGQAMVRIPKFYVRVGLVPSGPYTGQRYWLISSDPLANYDVHPAFMNAGSPIDQFWVGKYAGTDDGSNKLGSKAGVLPLTNLSFATMQARASARNVLGVTGFGIWDYYQLNAIQLLALVEMGSADAQGTVDYGYSNGWAAGFPPLPTDDSTVARATWRGIVGLWGNVFQMVQGLKAECVTQFVAPTLQIFDNLGNKTWCVTSQSTLKTGHYLSLSRAVGSGYNLNTLLLPSAINDGTVNTGYIGPSFMGGDNYHEDVRLNTGTYAVAHGGNCKEYAGAGLFDLMFFMTDSIPELTGSRLAKV